MEDKWQVGGTARTGSLGRRRRDRWLPEGARRKNRVHVLGLQRLPLLTRGSKMVKPDLLARPETCRPRCRRCHRPHPPNSTGRCTVAGPVTLRNDVLHKTLTVRPSLELGDGGPIDVENIADSLLGHRPGLSQFMKGHGCASLRLAGVDTRPTLLREVLCQIIKLIPSAHSISPSPLSSFKCSSWSRSARGTNCS